MRWQWHSYVIWLWPNRFTARSRRDTDQTAVDLAGQDSDIRSQHHYGGKPPAASYGEGNVCEKARRGRRAHPA